MKEITRSAVARLLPVRVPDAHKGDYGRVLVVAGSRGMCGAGFLCAKSALLVGAGLVYWALPESMQPSFAAALPEAITVPLPQTQTGEISQDAWPVLQALIERIHPSVLVIGPGMGKSPLLPLVLAECRLPLVLDADALNTLAEMKNQFFKQPVIFTPHPGEMARLLQKEIATDSFAREHQIGQWLTKAGGVCVLKGRGTLVAVSRDGQTEIWQNTTGGSALAKGGSGDVLAGMIAGLWSQLGTKVGFDVMSAFQMAACAVYIHGLAGDLAAQAKSVYSVLASDTAQYIGPAIRQILNQEKAE
ncbi:MAG: NAD(P)H-hydrate dehydratase [Elusimicrobiaceae bacterium]|nr:NAD(P)H-hydrate dehydratase [Elusimicrobiaceae bacterium]